MSRINLEGMNARDIRAISKMKFGVTIQDIADNHALSVNSNTLQFLDPAGGAKDVLLPAPSAEDRGLLFIIVNMADAAEAITLKTAADAALSPAIDIAQSEAAIVFWTGTVWRGLVGANT